MRAFSAFCVILIGSLTACFPPDECGDDELCLVVGTGRFGFNEDGLPGRETDIHLPTSVRPGRDGALLFADFNNLRIRALEADGTVSTRVGDGTHAYSEPGSPRLESPLENPIDMFVGPDGLLYVVPLHEGRILRVTDDDTIEVVAGTGELGESGDGGPAREAQLWYPAGIAFAEEDLYVADQVLGTLRRIDTNGVVDTVMRDLELPRGIWANEERVLVADSRNGRVQQYDIASGDVSTLVEGLDWPDAIAVSPGGTVVVAEQGASRLVAVDEESFRPIAGTGESEEAAGVSAPPMEMPLKGPGGLHFVGDDLWVADTEGSRIYVWDSAATAID